MVWRMTVARTRSGRTVGTETGNRRTTDSENRALIRAGGDMVQGGGGGDLALVDLVCTEGQR